MRGSQENFLTSVECGLCGTLNYDPETGEFYFCDQFGYLLTHQQTRTVIDGLNKHLDESTDEELEIGNKETDLDWEKHKWGWNSKKEPSIPAQKRTGYIYFVQDGEGRVKIGKAISISNRMKEYTKLPTEPIILHTFASDNYDDAEILIHDRYAEKRIRGEWFALTNDDIEFIKSGDLEKIVISLLS